MGHIFISYSHKDSTYVHKLAEALEQEGFEVWIDDRIHYGSEWPKVVTRNLDVSDGVIVVLSKNSYESDMVQNEVARAREKKKSIFPVLLDGDNWLIVQAKQFVDARDGALPPEKFYKRLEEITPRKNEKTKREAVEKTLLEAKELTKQKTAREKTERDLIEKVAGDDVAGEQALHEAKEKALSESMPRENAVIDRLIKSKREEAEKAAREKAGKKEAEKVQLEAEEQSRKKTVKERADRNSSEQNARDKEKELAERARLDARKQESFKIDETYTKIKPWIAYGGAISIGLFFGIFYMLVMAIPAVPGIIFSSYLFLYLLLIFSCVFVGVWLVLTRRRLAFFLSYIVWFLLVVLVNDIVSGSSLSDLLFNFFLLGFFGLFIVLFLLEISATKKLFSKILLCCVVCVVLIFIVFLGNNTMPSFFNIPLESIYGFLPYVFIYFLFCSFFGNWLRRVLKNRLPNLFAEN